MPFPPSFTPKRQSTFPNAQPFNPTTLNTRVTNTVSVTGSVTSSITGSVTVSGTVAVSSVPNPVTVSGTVTVSTVSNPVTVSGTVNPTTSASFATNQVTVTSGGAATQIFAINTSTIFREVINPTASNATVFLGTSGVVATVGHFLPGGAAFDQGYNSAALYGIAATGSVTVSTIGW